MYYSHERDSKGVPGTRSSERRIRTEEGTPGREMTPRAALPCIGDSPGWGRPAAPACCESQGTQMLSGRSKETHREQLSNGADFYGLIA